MQDYDFECVILTHGDKGTPHLDTLKASNPSLKISIKHCPTTNESWRNADRNIRGVTTEKCRVLFLDYDVLVNIDLREVFSEYYDLDGVKFKDASVSVLHEVALLPDEYRNQAKTLSPLAVVMLSKNALDEITSSKYDELFKLDLVCEIRLPTVIAKAGLSCNSNSRLSNVCQKPFIFDRKGKSIFHPLK